MLFYKKNIGFTLAEVLITLGLIGIIASLTIPGLLANNEKQRTIAQYQKVISEISQAIKLSEVDNGFMDTWSALGYDSSAAGTEAFAEQCLYPYLQMSQKCSNQAGCWKTPVSLSNTSTSYGVGRAGFVSAITKSGYSIYFRFNVYNIIMIVDLDGPNKGKGIYGKDVFSIRINFKDDIAVGRKGIYPWGLELPTMPTRNDLINHVSYGCNKTLSGSQVGGYCGALILLDGWQIKDDYAW